MKFLPKLFIPALIIILILINVGILIYTVNSEFHYSLDDPFIHLEIANNLVEFGNYGINESEFTSPSSSPLWTFLLSGIIYLFGNYEYIPLYLNLLISIIFVILYSKYNNKKEETIILLFATLLTSIPVLIINGMEHILHISLFAYIFFKLNSLAFEKRNLFEEKLLLIVIALLTLVRLETLFFIFCICVILFLRKEYKQSIILGLISISLMVLFGLFSVYKGSTFLPSSILLKSDIDNLTSTFQVINRYMFKWILNLGEQTVILSLMIILSIILLINKNTKYKYHIITFIFTCLLHSYFAKFGWLYRYEAYLVFIGLILIGKLFIENKERVLKLNKVKLVFVLLVVSIPFLYRLNEANTESRKAIYKMNIQQYQMAQFVKEYYNNDVVACNDLGAISYFTNAKIIDLFGLGSNQISKAKISYKNMEQVYESLLDENNCNLIIVYNNWFGGKYALPEKFIDVCEWDAQVPLNLGSNIITFKTKEFNIDRLKNQISEYIQIKYNGNPPFKVRFLK